MFLESMVLPTPLGPSRTRFLPSRRNSKDSARSMSGRSIFFGQFQSKSAMGLKAPRRLRMRRRSRERLERSAISQRRMSSRVVAVASRPRAWSWEARSFIEVLLLRVGEQVVSAEVMGLDVQGGELRPVGEIDGQGRLAVGFAAVLLDQVFDGSQSGSAALQSLVEGGPQEIGAVEHEQA